MTKASRKRVLMLDAFPACNDFLLDRGRPIIAGIQGLAAYIAVNVTGIADASMDFEGFGVTSSKRTGKVCFCCEDCDNMPIVQDNRIS